MAYLLLSRLDCDGQETNNYPDNLDLKAIRFFSLTCLSHEEKYANSYFEGLLYPIYMFTLAMCIFHVLNVISRWITWLASNWYYCPKTRFRCRCCCTFCLDRDQYPDDVIADDESEDIPAPRLPTLPIVIDPIENKYTSSEEEPPEEELTTSSESTSDTSSSSNSDSSTSGSEEADIEPRIRKMKYAVPNTDVPRMTCGSCDCTVASLWAWIVFIFIVVICMMAVTSAPKIDEELEDLMKLMDNTVDELKKDMDGINHIAKIIIRDTKNLYNDYTKTINESERIIGMINETRNEILVHETVMSAGIDTSMLNFDLPNIPQDSFDIDALNEIKKQVVTATNDAAKIVDQQYHAKYRDWTGGRNWAFITLSCTSILFIIIITSRAYCTTCFTAVDSCFLAPVCIIIFFGLLMDLSSEYVNDICENTSRFGLAAKSHIQQMIPPDFATDENVQYYVNCPEQEKSPFHQMGNAKIREFNFEKLMLDTRIQVAQGIREVRTTQALTEAFLGVVADYKASLELNIDKLRITAQQVHNVNRSGAIIQDTRVQDNDRALTNIELLPETLEEANEYLMEALEEEIDAATFASAVHPSNMTYINTSNLFINGEYINPAIAEALVGPVNMFKLHFITDEDAKGIAPMISVLQKMANDSDGVTVLGTSIISDLNATRVHLLEIDAFVETSEKYVSTLRSHIDQTETIVGCDNLHSKLAPVKAQICDELKPNVKDAANWIYYLLWIDVIVIVSNYLCCFMICVYHDTTTKPTCWAVCPCLENCQGTTDMEDPETQRRKEAQALEAAQQAQEEARLAAENEMIASQPNTSNV